MIPRFPSREKITSVVMSTSTGRPLKVVEGAMPLADGIEQGAHEQEPCSCQLMPVSFTG
jgi:hypothetical protein